MPTESPKTSKTDAVYRILRENILEGRYSVGYRLVLAPLARELGVSPAPIREALRRLEAERLVRFIPNVGVEVLGFDRAGYADVMGALAVIEGAVTAHAARMITPIQLERARAINEKMRSLLGEDFDPLEFTRLNQRFHETLCAPCTNVHLLGLLHAEWERIGMIRKTSFSRVPGRSRSSVEEHDVLLSLVSEGAPAGDIEANVRAHKLRTRDIFLGGVGETPQSLADPRLSPHELPVR